MKHQGIIQRSRRVRRHKLTSPETTPTNKATQMSPFNGCVLGRHFDTQAFGSFSLEVSISPRFFFSETIFHDLFITWIISRVFHCPSLKNILSQINVLPLPDGLVQASKFEDLFPDFASQDLMNISRYGNTEPPAYHQTCEV